MYEGALHREMGINARQLSMRLRALGVDSHTRLQLKKLQSLVKPHLPWLVEKWFEFGVEEPSIRELLLFAKKRGHLGPGMIRQLNSMMAGRYGLSYLESRLRVGLIHERVGVEPSWYMGAWRSVADLIRQILDMEKVPAVDRLPMLAAMERVVQLDQVLALDAYFFVKNRAIVASNEELSELAAELKVKNETLADQYRQVQEASRIKEEFLSRVSHELRTPLNSIIGFADILLDGIDGPLTAEQEKSVQRVRRAGEVLLGLIDGILSAARMAASGIVKPVAFDLLAAVGLSLEKTGRGAAAKGLDLKFEEPRESFPKVLGDEQAFVSALSHVLDNAVKFTAEGGITVGFCRVSDGVRVFVSDTGPGVPQAERDHIFEAFHQVDGGDARTHEGLGMGLTLAARAMRAMGGMLDVSSNSSGGAMFCLWLPFADEGGSGVGE